ncbi:MAG: ABC transporter permease [Oscillospiraceae bacterium]
MTGRAAPSAKRKSPFLGRLKKQTSLQLMVWFGLAFIIVFRIFPIYGMQLAFKELLPGMSIAQSPWVGLKHFENFFYSGAFTQVMANTITLSLAKILIGFPIPVIFALLLNEIRSHRAKSLVQGISYLPYFLSWVVIFGVTNGLLAMQGGVINDLLMAMGIIQSPIHFLGTPSMFKPLMVILDVWKEAGWGAIIYMAAIAGIDEQLYEAARVDGAGRLRQIFAITLPLIMPTVVIMLILRVGNILDAGFDQILVFRNAITHDVANILDIYVYDIGLKQGRFGYATAVGLFKSIISFGLVYGTNKIASRYDMGFW